VTVRPSDLNYPVLCLRSDGIVFSMRNADRLTTCSMAAFRKGIYSKLELVEANGRSHLVQSASRRRATLSQRLGLAPIRVDLELEERGEVRLDEVKERVVAAMNARSELWDAAVGKDIADWQRQVMDQRSIHELANLLLIE
jgi:hypothetical protein